ncbi:glycoside hydrolase family 3 protein [Aestuariibacter sp. A3R04]|uniref:glycoside hydrolase family 3 protein n=1 Tax=Aestuariibacter sp. A3R04 TaxID=2841571 RepID=UPI001C09A452|nr:glycoside hydrolase family 3 protein [Aestuariibacter sp. A3R04]MBU3020549.1 glycoside hydrolase family 3 protein [Aestuariibacter sp. A3R04]
MYNFLTRSKRFFQTAVCVCGFTVLHGCAMPADSDTQQIRRDLAQKFMLDFRYFCEEAQSRCREPMTVLPPQLSELVSESGLGGVILFSENLAYPQQIAKLTQDLQKAAQQAENPQPLLIGIDQEGGRVFRTPRVFTTDFAGNMALGATWEKSGTYYASASGKIMAQELKALGVNTNFAPDVDVNANLANPVINIRSFGQSPQRVAELGEAQVIAMQREGVLATVKHFPGHGDTHTDSHLGLPVVNHDRATVDAIDLYPFKAIIEKANPAAVMTAHIQYPQLDSSTLTDKNGNEQIKPATLSRKILTGILRDEWGYDGLIVTDALNMAGIAKFFDQTEAVAATFAAGTDMAVMPLPVHTTEDIAKYNDMLDELVAKVQSGELDRGEITASAERIRRVKKRFALAQWDKPDIAALSENLEDNKRQAQRMADEAITLLKGNPADYQIGAQENVLVLMPAEPVCKALTYHFSLYRAGQTVNCMSLQTLTESALQSGIAQADTVILGSMTPSPSLVELGGMEDMKENTQQILGYAKAQARLPDLLKAINASGKRSVLVYLRMPYDEGRLDKLSDAVLATYNANVYRLSDDEDSPYTGATIDSLSRVLTGMLTPSGSVPVFLDEQDKALRGH